MSANDNDAMERRANSEVERLRARVAELEAKCATNLAAAVDEQMRAEKAEARVAEMEAEVTLREAQTQRMMLARDAMQRERDEARSGGWNHARAVYWTERAERAEADAARLRAALTEIATCSPTGRDSLVLVAQRALSNTAPAPLSEPAKPMCEDSQNENACGACAACRDVESRAVAEAWLARGEEESSGTLAFHDAPVSERERALVVTLREVRPLVESLREGVEDMHWYSARDAMLSALRAIDAALASTPSAEPTPRDMRDEKLPLPTGPRPDPERLAWLMSGMPKVGRTSVDLHVFDELRAEVNALRADSTPAPEPSERMLRVAVEVARYCLAEGEELNDADRSALRAIVAKAVKP